MTDNIIGIHADRIEQAIIEMEGPALEGRQVVIEGRAIPKLKMFQRGSDITLVLDSRFGIDVPRENAVSVAWIIANALAIGEGYSSLSAEDKVRPFAPKITRLGDIPR